MLCRILSLSVVALAAIGIVGVAPPAYADRKGIEPGDPVKVVGGSAPVKVGKQTLATVEEGAELKALKVKGQWVQVAVEKEGKKVVGWIHGNRLARFTAPSRAAKTPKGKPKTSTEATAERPKPEKKSAMSTARDMLRKVAGEGDDIACGSALSLWDDLVKKGRASGKVVADVAHVLGDPHPPVSRKSVTDLFGAPAKTSELEVKGLAKAANFLWYGPLGLGAAGDAAESRITAIAYDPALDDEPRPEPSAKPKVKLDLEPEPKRALPAGLPKALEDLEFPEGKRIQIRGAKVVSLRGSLQIELECSGEKDVAPDGALVFFLTKAASLKAADDDPSGPKGIVGRLRRARQSGVSRPTEVNALNAKEVLTGGFRLFKATRAESGKTVTAAGKLGLSRATMGPPFVAVLLYKRGEPGKGWEPLSNAAWVALTAP